MASHLGRNIIIEVPRILIMAQFRPEWRRVPMDIDPINAPEPRMSLNLRLCEPRQRHESSDACNLNKLSPVDTTAGPVFRNNKAATSCLDYHRVWSGYGRGCLRAKSIFRFTEELFHQIYPFPGHMRSRRELERLLKVQDLLSRNMPLTIIWISALLLEADRKRGTDRVADEWRVA